ncbi:uncharacterized protein BO95DRAFT_428702 [Aspergillus brunneoviolaceus CBS 621.78]|uniref:Uncharacterized protein n=1 Tax=Aspergillus brunneoviolaceus CBS 621.78 TaxID=1450534 RepID=A0ACD1GJ57_9EURO|nr:hypothetical protein BO95DRAFT_428702 [Aspergillus brunneoviolaceus CBS 621.78]RAH49296.1 hypothetical protein BO95DRAFT_428702 [Aspergillus brunneoviolaceus CBS 621.78]
MASLSTISRRSKEKAQASIIDQVTLSFLNIEQWRSTTSSGSRITGSAVQEQFDNSEVIVLGVPCNRNSAAHFAQPEGRARASCATPGSGLTIHTCSHVYSDFRARLVASAVGETYCSRCRMHKRGARGCAPSLVDESLEDVIVIVALGQTVAAGEVDEAERLSHIYIYRADWKCASGAPCGAQRCCCQRIIDADLRGEIRPYTRKQRQTTSKDSEAQLRYHPRTLDWHQARPPPKDDESASLSGNGAANRHLDETLDWLIRYTSRRRKKELSILPKMATRYAEEKGTWDKASRQEKDISEEALQRSRPAYYNELSDHETRLPADIQIGPVIHYDKSEKGDVFLDCLGLKPKLLDTEDE